MCGHRHYHHQEHHEHHTVERRDRSLRSSDRERDEVVTLLRDHAAEGRLSPEELDERVGRALAARTGADLDALLTDLPRIRTVGRRRGAQRAFLGHATTWLAVSLMLVAIWAVTGFGEFWPVWAIGFWGLAVFRHGRAVRFGGRWPRATA
jgi:hypothetical protein